MATESAAEIGNGRGDVRPTNERPKMLKTIGEPLQFFERLPDGILILLQCARGQERKFERSLDDREGLRRLVQSAR